MDTSHPQKFPFILHRNLAKANCTGNHVCTSCDTVVLGRYAKCGNLWNSGTADRGKCIMSIQACGENVRTALI